MNDQTANLQTLHTGPGCSISNDGGFSGSLTHSSCASSGDENTGCQIASSQSNSYGAGFNSNGGGVYATEWTDSCINVWFFPRGSIPSDVLGDAPNPSSWGTPAAKFQGDCDMSKSFRDQQIVFDTTFCGDWAGNTWSTSSCAQKAPTCDSYVQNNPSAFADAYWSINALKVYKEGVAASSAASTTYATSTAYVTQPLPTSIPGISISLSVPAIVPAPTATTFSVSTKSAGYVPVVGPSGSVVYTTHTASPPESSNTGYAPVVGTDGSIGWHAQAAPSEEVGSWSSTEDGVMVYHDKRHAKHLGHHRRHGNGRL